MSPAAHSPPNRNRSPGKCPVLFSGGQTPEGDSTLLEGFLAVAASDPGRVAVIEGGRRLTYSELDGESNRLARFLRGCGVRSGEFVGLSMGRSAGLVLSIFAVAKSGGAYLPLDPSYPAGRTARMTGIAKPVLVLGREDGAACGISVNVNAPDAPWRNLSADPLPVVSGAGSPIYCIFTSGSTGEPKGAVIKRGGFANLVEWYRREFRFGPRDKTLLVSAPGFDLTQKNFFAPLSSGGCLVIYPDGPFDPGLVSRMVHEHGITVLNWTPSAFQPLLEGDFSLLESLRLVVLGGEPISAAKVAPWLEDARCHAEIANTYGPTECTDICAFHRVGRGSIRGFSSVPVGGPVPNVQLALMDDSLRPAEGVGELVVGGRGIGLGYLGDPQLTAEKFVANPLPDFFDGPLVYRTGDMMRALPGGMLDFVGRTDHQVKVRGFRIELGEIESVLAGFPGLREVAVVVGGKGENAGLVAFHSPPDLDAAALSAHVRARLPEFMVPRFAGIASFPVTPHGKLDRLALAKRVAARPAAAVPDSPGSTRSRLRAIWAEILEESTIGLDEGFFDLGGDSIRLARMHARVMEEFGRMLPITDLFSHPTIRSLAHHLDGGTTGRMTARERMEKQREAVAAARGARP